jgi:hypothetical protein
MNFITRTICGEELQVPWQDVSSLLQQNQIIWRTTAEVNVAVALW